MTRKELESLYIQTENGIFTPLYDYDEYIIEKNEEIDEIISEVYTNLVVIKTAEEVYEEWLYNRDNQPISEPNKMEVLENELEELKSSQIEQDFLIDDLIFEVIPTLEAQINVNDVQPVQLASIMSNKLIEGESAMAAYLAKKIMDGRDYATVFRTYSYKQYQDDVDTILELEGKSTLIKR